LFAYNLGSRSNNFYILHPGEEMGKHHPQIPSKGPRKPCTALAMALHSLIALTLKLSYRVILVTLVLVKLFSFWIIAFRGGGVTTCKFVRIPPLDLPYLPIPTRSRNEGVRP